MEWLKEELELLMNDYIKIIVDVWFPGMCF